MFSRTQFQYLTTYFTHFTHSSSVKLNVFWGLTTIQRLMCLLRTYPFSKLLVGTFRLMFMNKIFNFSKIFIDILLFAQIEVNKA